MSFDYTGSFSGSFSGSFTGEIVSTNGVISSSAQVAANLPVGVLSSSAQVSYDGSGLVSQSNQVNYTQVKNKPTTISAFQKNSITANNRFREVTYPQISSSVSTRLTTLEAQTDDSGSDSQTLSFNSVNKNLTISDGNAVDLSSLAGGGGGGGSSIWSTGSDYYFVSSNLQVTGSFKVSQNVIADSFTGSLQGTADTASFISDTFISASAVRSGFGAGGDTTDISALNTFTGSIQTEVDSLTNATSSYLTSVPSGTISGSSQVSYNSISDVPSGILSSSTQIESEVSGAFSSTSSSIASDIADIISGTQIVASASYAISASHEIITEVSSSHAVQADTASFISDTFISASAVRSGFGSGGSSDTASFVEGITNFDGNRIVSNTNLPSGIYNVNFGTSGSISQFIEEVFFPNSVPVITSHGFTIEEFEISGSTVGTITATDAEGQSVTFRAASSYTDDFFKIASDGEITLNTQSTESMNTDNTPGSGSHPFPVEAVDTFNGVGSRTLYIRVNPNTAPKWRQTSVSGTVITTFTQSLNEDSAVGNNKARVFFSDDESDTITIGTGSLSADFSSKFSLDIESTYVQLNQTTASLDFEDITEFSFVLTASDQHYGDGDDTQAIAYLPFQVAVVDNAGPSVNDQSITGVNENTTDGDGAGSITATDPESNTITFSNFTLQEVNLDGGSDIKSTLNGESLYDPTRDPFQCSSTGVVTRKNGIYLNSDVANNYIYQVTVTDAFNTTSDTGLITIPIADDGQSTITDNWTNPYIIESALDGESVRINSNGRTGTIAQWSSAVSQRWEVSSENDLIEVTSLTGSTTQLRVKNDISGSSNSFDLDDRISVALTASEHGFETTKQFIDVDVRLAINNAPDIVFSNTSANLNTNGARSGSLLTTISFSDTESDALNHDEFTFTDPSGQLNSIKSGNTYLIQARESLSGSNTYQITSSIQDTHGFRTNTEEHTFTIAQSGIGTLTGDTTSFIISTAVSGANLQDATGEGNGNASDLNVSYSPNYNSQAVQSFTSSNAAIIVDNNGGLSLAVDMSTTTSGSGDTITTDITFRDQYDNIGSGSVTVNVFASDADLYGKVYVYDIGFNNATYNTAVGITSEDGSTPPVATPFSNLGFVDAIKDDNRIGSGSFTYTYGSSITATLLASGSGSDVHDVLRGMGSSGTINRNTNVHFVILMPSGSEMSGVPTRTRDSYGGSTLHEYVLEVGTDGTTIDGTNTIESSDINQFDLATSHFGYTTWFMVGATNQVTSTSNFNLGLSPSSGSGGV